MRYTEFDNPSPNQMKKLLILLAFAGIGVLSTACGESCYECTDDTGAVVTEACAADDDAAAEDMARIEADATTDGEDVACSLN